MAGTRERGETIRQFILENVATHRKDIVTFTSNALAISRQAANKHIRYLLDQGLLVAEGTTRNRVYDLKPLMTRELEYPLDGLKEDVVWRKDVAPLLAELPENVKAIWQYGFTEMLNNAIDHSAGTRVVVIIRKTAIDCTMRIQDDGEGIFRKIERELNLDDESHAILELAKGKLTTDPTRHSGEGIFFSSRMFDIVFITSGKIRFSNHHLINSESYLVETDRPFEPGTIVAMVLGNLSQRTTKEIFDKFSSDEGYGFTKTVVPVRLAQYGDEKLISRSQAKRLLARFDKFKVVVLDFQDVDTIGQAFADEVFRVFVREHPEVQIVEISSSSAVQQMISRARQHE